MSDKGRFRVDGVVRNAKASKVGTITYKLGGHRFKLHEIVLQTFCPEGIKDGYTPDHIDRRDRLNNSLSNLRWADKQMQVYNRENKEYKYKRVLCNENGIIYKSCQQAEKELGITHNTVARVARGERKVTCGYTFRFV